MTELAIEAGTTALVLIDLQRGIVGGTIGRVRSTQAVLATRATASK